jgi:small subunit ribosomal protein S14
MNINTLTKYRHLVHRDIKRRDSYKKNELRRFVLKSIALDEHLPLVTRASATLELSNLSGARSKIHNRCIITGRPRSVNRLHRISRLVFRRLASMGQLSGVMKSSW